MDVQELVRSARLALGIAWTDKNLGTPVPAKGRTKKKIKQQNTFQRNLQGVPGGSRGGFRLTYVVLQKMVEAEDTGTRLASDGEIVRLVRSASNAHTTRSYRNMQG